MNMLNKKEITMVAIAFFCMTIAVTFPLIFQMKDAVYGPFYNTDIRGGLWNLWWGQYALTHNLDYDHTPFIAAPFGVDFSNSPISWIVKLLFAALLPVISPGLCLNGLTIMSFVLCGVFSFLLVHYLTKNRIASFIAALIFTFSPFHLNKAMEFSFFFIGTWLVLYIFLVAKLKEYPGWKYSLCAILAFSINLALNPSYGYIALIVTICFLSFCLFFQWKEKLGLALQKNDKIILKKRFFEGTKFFATLFLVSVVSLILYGPILLKIVNSMFGSLSVKAHLAPLGYIRSLDYLFAQSARPLSYFLPASSHPILGSFTKKMFGSVFYGRGSIEQTLYLGWVPLILAYFAFRQWRQKRSQILQYPDYQASKENFYIGFFIFSAYLAFIFSMPPTIDLLFFKVYFPSYFLYKVLPMFRAYARFGILVSLSVSVLAGFGLKFLLERMKSPRHKQLFIAAISLFILFEFTNIPPLRATDISKVPSVYKWLGEQRGNFIVAEYPMAMAMAMTSPGEALENYDYLFYQTKHQKRLVNGAIAGTEAFEIRKKILKINDPETIKILKKLGVKYVILHTDLYRKGDYGYAADVVGEVPRLNNIAGWNLIKTFDTVYVYDIGNKPQEEEINAS
jgi:hypothetical protein